MVALFVGASTFSFSRSLRLKQTNGGSNPIEYDVLKGRKREKGLKFGIKEMVVILKCSNT